MLVIYGFKKQYLQIQHQKNTHGDDGKCRIIIPIARTSNRIKIKIAPDITDSGATDTLTVLGSENSIKGNR